MPPHVSAIISSSPNNKSSKIIVYKIAVIFMSSSKKSIYYFLPRIRMSIDVNSAARRSQLLQMSYQKMLGTG